MWTDMNPYFKKYEGMEPFEVGLEYFREVLERDGQWHTSEILRAQMPMFIDTVESKKPFNWGPPKTKKFKDWYTFWGPVYDLKDIPIEDLKNWDLYAIRALEAMLSKIEAVYIGP